MNHESQQILVPKKRQKLKTRECCNNIDYKEHIYENVTNRYKYKIFNEILNSFTSKAKDFKLLRKRDKLNYSSMNIRNSHDNDDVDDEIYDDDDDNNSIQFQRNCDDENSYTSCEEDNIYENLDFFNDVNYFYNDSLDDWMERLSHEVAEYEMDNIMFVKSIPSVFNIKQPRSRRRKLNKCEITLNFLKILCENNADMMSLLLQTFSNLLRDQCINTQQASNNNQESTTAAAVSSKKLVKSKRRMNLKKNDKKNYQKFVKSVILSISLNSLVITYNKSLKFYFTFVCSEVFFKLPSTVRVTKLINLIKIKFKFNCEEIELIRQLLKYKFNEIKVQKSIESAKESIYQQIWTCQSISNDDVDCNKGMIARENIYATIESVRDDNQWEIDDEFKFVNAEIGALNMTNQYNNNNNDSSGGGGDDYKTVWVLYSDENPDLNKFFYDSSYTNYLSNTKDNNNNRDENMTIESEQKSIEINHDIPEKYYEAVDSWKVLLRNPYYMEDEEDIIVNESILSANFPYYNYDTEDESNRSVIESSSFSLQLDESSSIKSSSSPHESYRSITEDVIEVPSTEKISDSPKKEREKFRDKFKAKLKIRPGKSDTTDSISIKSDDDPEKYLVFGGNLEKVEKDIEHKDIPKIIVECIKALELESNVKTSGIYRISGNKVTIDAIKKKLNEKKVSKKETSRYALLQEQDVHTLTGLLKMFFRELKSPIMNRKTFEQCSSERQSSSQMSQILREMPNVNYATLKHLFRHFKTIERYQDENLMNSSNLAICLGLCLFSQNNFEAPNPFDNDISKCNMLCKYLIDNYFEVFENNHQV